MSHTSDTLKAQLKQSFEERRKEWHDAGVEKAMQELSQAVSVLQKAGVDVEIEMKGKPSQMVFKMTEGGCTVPAYGYVKTGNLTRVIGLFTRRGSRNCLEWGLSSFDIEAQNGSEDIRPKFYNAKSAAGIMALQDEIMEGYVRGELLREYDTENAFTHKSALPTLRRIERRPSQAPKKGR